ncbi:MAG: 50S ribosomal protein L10 [Thermoplasmata archaeon]|nr:MAG: 50S ribosomal protein L10 [Thermoplasmata archaeon]RLF35531.1 MAG: 50S ribosomal protein L10 [Thermoplasmata archaeon]
MAHVAKWKYDEVQQLTSMLTKNRVIGIAEIGGIPAPQLQQMRKNLSKNAYIKCAKNSLILRALEEAEKKTPGIAKLKESIQGQTAIIATDMNPFKLFKQIKSTKTTAPAKGGETATHDIEVKAGDTPFKPGPIVGELQKAGIPAVIREGKVVIKEDKTIIHAGEKIPQNVAQMLTRLEIYPIEIGMNLHAVYENGNIFKPDILDINTEEFIAKIQQAISDALKLAIESTWTNKTTIKTLLQKAYINALILSTEKNIPTKENIKHLIAKAHRNTLILASQIPNVLDENLKKTAT